MTAPVVLAIDAGTGSGRVLAFDGDGHAVARASREWHHAPVEGHPGGTVFDTKAGWAALASASREVMERLNGRPVASIAASSMREGFVLYGADGGELWACPNTDGRARREADELVAEGVADRIYATAGDWVSITLPARLRWLARHETALLASARHLGMLSDWVTTRLTGTFTTEPTCGSSSALFDLRERRWSSELAAAVGLPVDILPEVVECGTRVGSVTTAAATATGIPVGTPVVAGGADTQLALHGIDAREGTPTIVAGTFWQTTAITRAPLVDAARRLRTLCHVDPGTWMIEGINFLSGLAMRWFRDAMCPDAIRYADATGDTAFGLMDEWAAHSEPGSGGILALLSNVMQADAWYHASPTFVGFDITDPHTSSRGAFVRAIEEAAAIVAAAHIDILSEITRGRAVSNGNLIFTGGSSSARLWPSIVAAVTGIPTYVTPAPDATSYGAARLAATGVGAELPPMPSSDNLIVPDRDDVSLYKTVASRWHRAYSASLGLPGVTPLFTPPGAARMPKRLLSNNIRNATTD